MQREREIRNFVKTPFYRILGDFSYEGQDFQGEWRVTPESKYFQSPALYSEKGFREKADALALCRYLDFDQVREELKDGAAGEPEREGQAQEREGLPSQGNGLGTAGGSNDSGGAGNGQPAKITKVERKKEKKNPPLLFNLAELQNTCSKLFKISPDETLKIVQELYEKKLVTYPRTDARVLSTAVAKEIHKNIAGLRGYAELAEAAEYILAENRQKGIAKTKYVNDKQITDHYAIIPTGQGLGALRSVSATASRVYEVIARRFLCIFYPPAEYLKLSVTATRKTESFFANFKVMKEAGYLAIATASFARRKGTGASDSGKGQNSEGDGQKNAGDEEEVSVDENVLAVMQGLKKGMEIQLNQLTIKEGETSPPKRYNSGSMILAMENAGQLIEDEDLRAQIKSSGIGTSATRAEILSKLVKIKYLKLNKKTQMITPELLGEMVYDVVTISIKPLLNPELTASWELGLTQVADGSITEEEYMVKLNGFIQRRVDYVKQTNYSQMLRQMFDRSASFYKKG